MTTYLVIRHCFTVATKATERSTVSRPMPKSKAIALADKLNDQEVKGTPIPENEGKIISFSTTPNLAAPIRAQV